VRFHQRPGLALDPPLLPGDEGEFPKGQSMISVGIDFGTSNSSVAVFDGSRLRLLDLDRAAPDPRVMRSLLYITRDGVILAGHAALENYTRQNTGREVRLERKLVGEIDMVFSDMTLHRHVFGLVDANAPGRLFQSLKRFLADSAFETTDVFGTAYTIEGLLGTLAGRIVDAAQASLGSPITDLVIGRPVRFSQDEAKDRLAKERLESAWRHAGVKAVRFLEEPVAAVHHFGAEAAVPDGSRIAVFDFGGGTLDITVAERVAGRTVVGATGGIPLGGDLLDSRLEETEMAPSFGERAHFRSNGLPVPAHLFARLKSWQSIIELNRPELLDLIRRARRGTDQPERLAAFETLVTRNYGFELFRAIEAAKLRLSAEDEAEVSLDLDGIEVRHRVERHDWEATISPQVREARNVVLRTLADAQVDPEGVDFVVTTGGSSLIPAFRRMLTETMPNATLRAADTFTSVAAGLALWGARSE
jgi:hypothetical chaperone protein